MTASYTPGDLIVVLQREIPRDPPPGSIHRVVRGNWDNARVWICWRGVFGWSMPPEHVRPVTQEELAKHLLSSSASLEGL